MDTIFCESNEALASELSQFYYDNNGEYEISVVTQNHSQAIDLVSELEFLGFAPNWVSLDKEHECEYLLTISDDGVSCDAARNSNGEPVTHSTDILYIHNDASSVFFKTIKANDVIAYELCDVENDYYKDYDGSSSSSEMTEIVNDIVAKLTGGVIL